MRNLVLATAMAGAVVAAPTAASAMWSASASGTADMGADTMTNAADLRANCAGLKNKTPVTLTWVASPDSYVTGYSIVRTNATGATAVLPVDGRATASFSDVPPSVKLVDRYTYSIRAVSSSTSWTTSAVAGLGTITYTNNACVTI